MDQVCAVASILRAERSRISEDWRGRVINDPELPTEALTECELEDDIPNLLTRIVDALEEFARWRDDAEARGELAGRGPPTANHMRLRMRQGYSLSQVLRELHHLREAIVDVCAGASVTFAGDAARIVHSSIDAAMILAVPHTPRAASGGR